MKMHNELNYISPDEVAECWDGVSQELYAFIWNSIVPIYDKDPRSEVPDDLDRRAVARFWTKFPKHLKKELNTLAASKTAMYDTWRASLEF